MKKKIVIFLFLVTILFSFYIISQAEYKETISIEFKDLEKGDIEGTEFALDWTLLNPAGNKPKIMEIDEKRFLRMDGYSQVVMPGYLYEDEEYIFETKIRIGKQDQYPGFFIRATEPILRENPFHSEYSESNKIQMHIQFYEIDWYYEATKKGPSTLGGSGIVISPKKEAVRIAINTYIDEGLFIGTSYHDFPYPEGSDPTDFVKYTVKDNGKDKIEIHVDDKLLATINLSDTGSYEEEDPIDTNMYHRSATILDKDGNEVEILDQAGNKVNKIDNARVAEDEYLIAFACRTQTYDIESIVLKKEVKETPEPTAKPDETLKPDTSEKPKSTDKVTEKEEDGDFPYTLVIIVSFVSFIIVILAVVYVLKVVIGGKKNG